MDEGARGCVAAEQPGVLREAGGQPGVLRDPNGHPERVGRLRLPGGPTAAQDRY